MRPYEITWDIWVTTCFSNMFVTSTYQYHLSQDFPAAVRRFLHIAVARLPRTRPALKRCWKFTAVGLPQVQDAGPGACRNWIWKRHWIPWILSSEEIWKRNSENWHKNVSESWSIFDQGFVHNFLHTFFTLSIHFDNIYIFVLSSQCPNAPTVSESSIGCQDFWGHRRFCRSRPRLRSALHWHRWRRHPMWHPQPRTSARSGRSGRSWTFEVQHDIYYLTYYIFIVIYTLYIYTLYIYYYDVDVAFCHGPSNLAKRLWSEKTKKQLHEFVAPQWPKHLEHIWTILNILENQYLSDWM